MFEQEKVMQGIQSRSKLISTVVGLVTLAIALLIYQFGWFSEQSNADAAARSGPPPAAVAIAYSRTMTMAPHTVLPGTVVSTRDAVIAAETSGKVLRVAFVGDVIELGDSIAELDSKNAQQLVDQRRAELQRLQSLYTYHSNYFKRINIEESKLGIPEIGIAQLKSNVETAKADVARATSALASANTDLQRASISAPFAGSVVSQSIQPGEFAQIGSPIARLVDTKNLEISARVPAALLQPIEPGTLLNVTGMGKTLQAPMRALVPVGDSVSRTMELRISLQDSGLLVGSPVRVSLPSAMPKEVVAVPRDAIVLRADSQYIFVIKDGKAERQEVELGYAQGDMIEVIGNVAPDAVVVIRGGERLRDGQDVAYHDNAESGSSTVSNAF